MLLRPSSTPLITALLWALSVPGSATAQDLSPRSALARSLLPEALQSNATVIERSAKGEIVVQKGSGDGFICSSDDQRPGRMGLICLHPSLAAMNALERDVASKGLRGDAFRAELCGRAETSGAIPPNGTLEISASVGVEADGSFEPSMTVYHLLWVPHATTQTIGIEDEDPGDGSAWLHLAGTCQSHVMWSEEIEVAPRERASGRRTRRHGSSPRRLLPFGR